MRVRELIDRLGEFEPDMIVCLADWNEQYELPSERAAEDMSVVTGKYRSRIFTNARVGTFLLIGAISSYRTSLD